MNETLTIRPEDYNEALHELPRADSELYAYDYVSVIQIIGIFKDGRSIEAFLAEVVPPFWNSSGQIFEDAAEGDEVRVINSQGMLIVRVRP